MLTKHKLVEHMKKTVKRVVKKSKTVRHLAASPNRHTKTSKSLKRVLIGICILLLLGAGALLFTVFVTEPKAKKHINKDELQLEALLTSSINVPKGRSIDSTLGFSVAYDAAQFNARGQVTDPKSTDTYVFGETFDNDDLKSQRAYSILKFTFKEPEQEKNGNQQAFTVKPLKPELSIVTNIRKDYWDNRAKEPENRGLSKLDMAVNANNKIVLKDNSLSVTKPVDITIGGVVYKKLEYTQTKNTYGVPNAYRQVVYVTVQNDRPYFITISFINNANNGETKLYESLISTIQYKPLGDNTLGQNNGDASQGQVAGVSTADLPSSTTKAPYSINQDSIIDVILKNQPSVVRVATIYCLNADLLLPSGSVGLALSEACVAAVGSGSIISSDGHIATNGHVVTMHARDALSSYIGMAQSQDELLRRTESILGYLRSVGAVKSYNARTLVNAVLSGDAEALNVLSSLGSLVPPQLVKVRSEKSDFAIQTSNQPIRLNSSMTGFDYSATILKATFIDKNFDNDLDMSKGINFLENRYSDVAILKTSGKFPFINLGDIESTKAGDSITAIGFPAFTDGGLDTKQATTPPTATQGSVLNILTKYNNQQKLIATNVPIAQGNSGGPAFNAKGQQIGLNTYGQITCPDHKCFGDGVSVDVADLKALLSKNSIQLAHDDAISAEWTKALVAYNDGNYKAAIAGFKKVEKQYPANYLAKPLIKLAESKRGSDSDTSDGFLSFSNIKLYIALVLLIGLAAGTWFIVHLHRGTKQGVIAQQQGYGVPAWPQNTASIPQQQTYNAGVPSPNSVSQPQAYQTPNPAYYQPTQPPAQPAPQVQNPQIQPGPQVIHPSAPNPQDPNQQSPTS